VRHADQRLYNPEGGGAPLISDGAMVAAVNRSLAGPTIESDDVFMSAFGTKRTSLFAPHMSAIGGKADMTVCTANVCF
jgi:hypothetical protein